MNVSLAGDHIGEVPRPTHGRLRTVRGGHAISADEARESTIKICYQSFTDPAVDAPYFTRLTDEITSLARPGAAVTVIGMEPGDRYLHPITEFRCAAQVIANALQAQDDGFDAFIIGHFQEPALQEVRAAVRIPVIGLGESTMLHALTLGRKAALVTINPVFIPYHEDQIRRYGLGQRVTAVRAVTAQVADYNRAFEDRSTYERMRDEFVAQSRPLLESGVDVIIPAGGYPMLLFAQEPDFTIDGATVLNGLPVAVAAADTAVHLVRRSGTCTSRRGAYGLPAPEAVQEFRQLLSNVAAKAVFHK
jgi:allantoin racemase